MISANITEGSRALQPFDKMFWQEPSGLKSTSMHYPIHLHAERCSSAIGKILDSVPNLKTLSFYDDVMFPFCKRIGQDYSPLVGLSSKLKRIEVTPMPADANCTLSGANAIWLLCLPNLEEAILSIRIRKSDFKFFKQNEVVLNKGLSRVKLLSLGLSWNYSLKPELSGEPFRCITNVTKNLKDLTLKAGPEGYLDLNGLTNSIHSLTKLTLKRGFFSPSDSLCLANFANVRNLSGDSKFVFLLASHFLPLLSEESPPGTLKGLPPLLETIKLTTNSYAEGDEMIRQFATVRESEIICPEFGIYLVMRIFSIPSTFREVISYRQVHPKRNKGSISELERGAFERARSALKEECVKKKIQLTFLDEVEDLQDFH